MGAASVRSVHRKSRNPSSVVLIASPDFRVRRRWRKELETMFAIYAVGSRHDLERRIEKLKPSVLLIDLALPHLNGIQGLPNIQQLSSQTKIIILTLKPKETEKVLALEAGAKGYCSTELDSLHIRKAVQVVQKGEIWVERSIVVRLLEELLLRTKNREKISPADQGRLQGLTRREHEIACLVGRAASNKEIATKLNITEATVKAHLTSIFRKLGVSDRVRLALFVKEKSRESLKSFGSPQKVISFSKHPASGHSILR